MHSFCMKLYVLAISLIILSSSNIYSAVSTLPLKYKAHVLIKDGSNPIINPTITVVDVNKDNHNEIAISENGRIQILDWNGTDFLTKWKSPQYTIQLSSMILNEVSPLVKVNYLSNQKLETDYLFFTHTSMRPDSASGDLYKLTYQNNKYELLKLSKSPFNRFDSVGTCLDGTSFVIGWRSSNKGAYSTIYKWNGINLSEKWQSIPGISLGTTGNIPNTDKQLASTFLLQNNNELGFVSCSSDSIQQTKVYKKPSEADLWKNKLIDMGSSILGYTKKDSAGELWSIQFPNSEYDYSAKVYMAQFDGKQFSAFSPVKFKGIDSNMIFKLVISDIDNDGVGEILGVEEVIRKVVPRKHPEDETDTLLITTNLFLAKWNGKEYVVKWHLQALDDKVSNILVNDVIGNGKKNIIIIDEEGYLYIFDMPVEQ